MIKVNINVCIEASPTFKGGIFGKILEPIFSLMIRRMAPRAFAALKYFIEHGEPYTREGANLPRSTAAC